MQKYSRNLCINFHASLFDENNSKLMISFMYKRTFGILNQERFLDIKNYLHIYFIMNKKKNKEFMEDLTNGIFY